jgi:hypothetical protein
MSGIPVVICPAGVWTRVYQWSVTFGVIYVTIKGAPSPPMQYREYSASPPFYGEGKYLFGSQTPFYAVPTPYFELWVKPPVTTSIFVSGT